MIAEYYDIVHSLWLELCKNDFVDYVHISQNVFKHTSECHCIQLNLVNIFSALQSNHHTYRNLNNGQYAYRRRATVSF